MLSKVEGALKTRIALGVLAFSTLSTRDARSEAALSVGLQSSVTSNLFQDSTDTADWTRSLFLSGRYYPTSTTEINLSADGISYSEFSQANRVGGQVGLTQILARKNGQARCLAEFRLEGRRYGDEGDVLDESTVSGTLAWASDALRSPSYRGGIRTHATVYQNATYANNWQVEAYGGFNATLPGNNSFDLEAGAALIGLQAFLAPFGFIDPSKPEAYLMDTGLTTVYASPRWSHPIGSTSGVSFQYTVRWPIRGRDLVVYGFSSGYFSPWADAFYGNEFTLRTRSLAIAPLHLDLALSYSARNYLYNINSVSTPTLHYEGRTDHYGTAVGAARWPMNFVAHTRLEANLLLQFTTNESSSALYTYQETRLSLGLSWSL